MNKTDKKQKIADAAFALFTEKGYAGTKIIDIAERAGIGKGTIYEYYTSKEDILCNIINDYVLTEYSQMSDIIKTDDSPEAQLREFVDFQINTISKHNITFKKLLSEIEIECVDTRPFVQSIMKALLTEFSVIYKILKDGIQQKVFKDINPTAAAYYILGTTHSMFPICAIHESVDPKSLGMSLPQEVTDAFLGNALIDKSDIYECIMNGISLRKA